jgi:flagellar biosynthesis/type III secretory pathway M-ring protein FliF/YscJ
MTASTLVGLVALWVVYRAIVHTMRVRAEFRRDAVEFERQAAAARRARAEEGQ